MDTEILLQEVVYKTARSGGAGGQHVNKVESKVMLQWDLERSQALNDVQKKTLREKFANRLTKEGMLQMESSESRSQFNNKQAVNQRFIDLLKYALTPAKKRVSTRIPKSKILERLDRKKKQSQKKRDRKKPFFD